MPFHGQGGGGNEEGGHPGEPRAQEQARRHGEHHQTGDALWQIVEHVDVEQQRPQTLPAAGAAQPQHMSGSRQQIRQSQHTDRQRQGYLRKPQVPAGFVAPEIEKAVRSLTRTQAEQVGGQHRQSLQLQMVGRRPPRDPYPGHAGRQALFGISNSVELFDSPDPCCARRDGRPQNPARAATQQSGCDLCQPRCGRPVEPGVRMRSVPATPAHVWGVQPAPWCVRVSGW